MGLVRRSRRRRGQHAGNEQLLCIVDGSGRQYFNFPQQVWVYPAIPMAYTKVPSTAMTNLAANLLALALNERGERSEARLETALASRYVLALARQFSTECLLQAPDEGWVIPRAAIRAWLAARLSSQTRSSRGGRLI
jgi:hypothetical protein